MSAVPGGSETELNEVATGVPCNVTVHKRLNFPRDGVAFRAYPEYKKAPWFDYGWVSVDRRQRGCEPDPVYPGSYRVLVRFWGFTEYGGKAYAFVDYYTKAVLLAGEVEHPVFKKYCYLKDRAPGNRGPLVPPFYCVPASSVVGTAAVYADPDYPQKPYSSTENSYHTVLYHPSFVELCDPASCSPYKLPSKDLFPPLPDGAAPLAIEVPEDELIDLTNEEN